MIRKTFACDFETSVYEGQTETEVWSSACVELGTEDVKVFGNIKDQYEYFKSLPCKVIAYYHNLKFDGVFWLSFLLEQGLKQAYIQINENEGEFIDDKEMENDSFKYLISDMGQWYTITIKTRNKIIELRDSLKLLPFSLERIGNSFNTKHKKLTMEYVGVRHANCEITPEELEYIKNDVLVLKEALEFMFEQGHTKLTIGSCCLQEFKRSRFLPADYNVLFPQLYDIEIPEEYFGKPNAGEYIKRSYRGGWCYVAKGKENRIFKNGCTVDVNSLYPSVMSSESGSYYPVGEPHFFIGEIPDVCFDEKHPKYYFVRFKTRFYIKNGKLPFVQIKNSLRFKQNECLESSDIVIDGKKYSEYLNPSGSYNDGRVTLTMTCVDYKLFLEHYNVEDFELLDGCWFHAEKGLFDEYIEKYKQIKLNSKGAMRELAKLFLNNLYGKMATSTNSSYKLVHLDEDGVLKYKTVYEDKKEAGYIAIGSAITSYARNFTIRAAQKNYYGKNKRGFIYADTDSIHCDLRPEEIKGVTLHDKNFCCWKIESEWDEAYFSRQKTYIEHVVRHDGKDEIIPYYDIKCAGMPPRCKYLFNMSLSGGSTPALSNNPLTPEEKEFVSVKRSISDFKTGLKVPGKLLPKNIKGGVILAETEFTFR